MKWSKNQKGYNHIVLSSNGKSRTFGAHRLMYEVFVGFIPLGMEINHIDGNKSNNNVSNLELVSRRENMRKAVEIGLIKSGSDCLLSKGVNQIDVITNEIIETFGSQREATKKTKVQSSAISSCCNGNRTTAGGFKWQFS